MDERKHFSSRDDSYIFLDLKLSSRNTPLFSVLRLNCCTTHLDILPRYPKMPLETSSLHTPQSADFARFASRRSVVHSTKGIVSCTQPLAAKCGLQILNAGGNAAVCVQLAVLIMVSLLTIFRMRQSPWVSPDSRCAFHDTLLTLTKKPPASTSRSLAPRASAVTCSSSTTTQRQARSRP